MENLTAQAEQLRQRREAERDKLSKSQLKKARRKLAKLYRKAQGGTEDPAAEAQHAGEGHDDEEQPSGSLSPAPADTEAASACTRAADQGTLNARQVRQQPACSAGSQGAPAAHAAGAARPAKRARAGPAAAAAVAVAGMPAQPQLPSTQSEHEHLTASAGPVPEGVQSGATAVAASAAAARPPQVQGPPMGRAPWAPVQRGPPARAGPAAAGPGARAGQQDFSSLMRLLHRELPAAGAGDVGAPASSVAPADTGAADGGSTAAQASHATGPGQAQQKQQKHAAQPRRQQAQQQHQPQQQDGSKKRKKFRESIYGNYHGYYGYRHGSNTAFDDDPRLAMLRSEWFEGRHMLDVGCNEGLVTLAVATRFGCASATGVDIDGGLIGKAHRNLRAMRAQVGEQLRTLGSGQGWGGGGAPGSSGGPSGSALSGPSESVGMGSAGVGDAGGAVATSNADAAAAAWFAGEEPVAASAQGMEEAEGEAGQKAAGQGGMQPGPQSGAGGKPQGAGAQSQQQPQQQRPSLQRSQQGRRQRAVQLRRDGRVLSNAQFVHSDWANHGLEGGHAQKQGPGQAQAQQGPGPAVSSQPSSHQQPGQQGEQPQPQQSGQHQQQGQQQQGQQEQQPGPGQQGPGEQASGGQGHGPRLRRRFGVIMCLSVTKWVHLNWGDDGLMRLFRRFRDCLEPGGYLVLEPQPWRSYKQALTKRHTAGVAVKDLGSLQLRPERFVEVLTQDLGFALLADLNQGSTAVGFDRPMYVLQKPGRAGAAVMAAGSLPAGPGGSLAGAAAEPAASGQAAGAGGTALVQSPAAGAAPAASSHRSGGSRQQGQGQGHGGQKRVRGQASGSQISGGPGGLASASQGSSGGSRSRGRKASRRQHTADDLLRPLTEEGGDEETGQGGLDDA